MAHNNALDEIISLKIQADMGSVMASRTLRKRLHHGDVDGKKNEHLETSGSDDLNEPLLGNYYSDTHAEVGILIVHLHGEWGFILLPTFFGPLWLISFLDLPQGSSLEETCDDERRKEHLHWTLLFSQLIAQWARWLGNHNFGVKKTFTVLLERFFQLC